MSELNLQPGKTLIPPWEYVPLGPYRLVMANDEQVVGTFYGPDLEEAVRIFAESGLPLRPLSRLGLLDDRSRLILHLYRDRSRVISRGCRICFEMLAQHYDPVLILDFELSAKEASV